MVDALPERWGVTHVAEHAITCPRESGFSRVKLTRLDCVRQIEDQFARLLNWIAEAEFHVERMAWGLRVFPHPVPVKDVPRRVGEDHIQHARRGPCGTTVVVIGSARLPTDRPAVAEPLRRSTAAIQPPVNHSRSQKRLLGAFSQAVGY